MPNPIEQNSPPNEATGPGAGSVPSPNADATTPWPLAPALLNMVYGFTDPTHNQEMVGMLKVTFLQHGTMMEGMRRTCQQQDARIRELIAELAVRDHQLADAKTRLENLREVRRVEKRAELEKELVLPGDPRFSQRKGN